MMEDNPVLRWLWPLLASLAGAVTALSFRPYAKMSPVDILMALFVGTTFAMPDGLNQPARIGSSVSGAYLNAYLEQVYFGEVQDSAAITNWALRN